MGFSGEDRDMWKSSGRESPLEVVEGAGGRDEGECVVWVGCLWVRSGVLRSGDPYSSLCLESRRHSLKRLF